MNYKILDEMKNKKGVMKGKVIRVWNKKPRIGLTYKTIQYIYDELLKKYKPGDFKILGKHMDGGFATLKNTYFHEKKLKYNDADYFSSVPKPIQKKLKGKYYSVDIVIKL